jgi:hypothetical protein
MKGTKHILSVIAELNAGEIDFIESMIKPMA